MENHLDLDPFAIFGLPYEFEIPNLDVRYYVLYRTGEKEIINLAYKILQDPLQRAKKLCAINQQNDADPGIAKNIMQLMKQSENEKHNQLVKVHKAIFEYARNSDWPKCWQAIQKYSYIKRLLG